MKTALCQICSKPFQRKSSRIKTCSPICSGVFNRNYINDWKRAHTGQHRVCVVCSSPFETKLGGQRTCSEKCSQVLKQFRWDRHNAAQVERYKTDPAFRQRIDSAHAKWRQRRNHRCTPQDLIL